MAAREVWSRRRWVRRGVLAAGTLGVAGAGCSASLYAGIVQAISASSAAVSGCGSTVAAPAAPAGSQWNDAQRSNAAAIIAEGRARGLPDRALVIAVATAMQESRLINVDHGDAAGPDSTGLFQQRDPWGPRAVRMDPKGAAGLFYDHLVAVPGWETMPATVAAQRVQRSAFPGAYARWENDAGALVAELAGVTLTSAVCVSTGAVGGWALPVPAQFVTLNPHHDYPASDLPVPAGTTVVAMRGGRVAPVTEAGGCGTGVQVTDPEGAVWMYCHGTARLVEDGTVEAGTPILVSGFSGHVLPPGPAGAHLHIQVNLAGWRCPQAGLQALVSGGTPPAVASWPTTGCSN